VRIVTFNTQHARRSLVWANTDALAGYCAGLGADVMALQELDAGAPRSAWKDQAAAVADAAGMVHVFGRARRVVPLGSHGIALLVRGTIEEARIVPLAHWRRHRGRCAVLAVVTADGRRLSVAATHLSPHRGENVPQLRAVVAELSAMPDPRLLLGDLNLLAAHVEPVLAGTGLRLADPSAPSVPADEPRFRVDHVAVSGLRVQRVEVPPRPPVSDHRAVLVEAG
jgi:endonuclease/exonuclease/phosphatase family metal-dependent hydrolase